MVSEVGRYIQSRHHIVSWCQKCVIESTDIEPWCQKCVDKSNHAWQIHRQQTGPLFQLIPGLQRGFHCVILDLKDLPSHLFRGIVTFNNWQSYCLDSSWTLTFLTHSTCCPVFPHQGGKYMEIHEIVVNLDTLLSISWVTLVQGTQATQAKDTQVTLTQTKRQRKFELFNPTQA